MSMFEYLAILSYRPEKKQVVSFNVKIITHFIKKLDELQGLLAQSACIDPALKTNAIAG